MAEAEAEAVVRTREAMAVRAMMLGTIIGMVSKRDYPVKTRDMNEWIDDEGTIQAVTIITASGLKLKVSVEFEGEEPT